ncbi:hypothetical protein [Streptacidiphilus carbonis]|uniref:hypothetical protein n=1 Tax=Streptacidiphilus carbonis TaxID=105422 RepID=UPI0005A71F9E|nr:hypothetical protein [Streptacidiphilus carbonis]
MWQQGRLQLAVALGAFVLTFLITRGVTHLIRSGRGPFGNVSVGGTHVHHVVPGIVLMVTGGFLEAGTRGTGWPATLAAALFGVGTGLVLDEFALVLHLDDVYWSAQGRLSVNVIALTLAVVGICLLGVFPSGSTAPQETSGRWDVALNILINVAFAVVAMAKGKFRLGLVGVLVPFVSIVAAVRLARPHSWWARHRYRKAPAKLERARAREERRVRRRQSVLGSG